MINFDTTYTSMRKLLIVLILLKAFNLTAQQHGFAFTGDTLRLHTDKNGFVRCATMEHQAYLEQQDPTYKAKLDKAQEQMDNWLKSRRADSATTDTEYNIPIVVHVLWNDTSQKISVAQVESQIPVLNACYNRQNKDTVNTPAPFKPVAANMHITFCLASVDPYGNPTNGIVYKYTTVTSFYYGFNTMKYPSIGGDTAWDVNRYLNIWVCNLQGGALGFSEFPTSPLNNTFGSAVYYQAFGTTGNLLVPFNQGGTATHEIGHLLNLHHTWGDDGGLCPSQNGGHDDGVADTPPEGNGNIDTYTNNGNSNGATYGCPTFPYLDNCSNTYPGIMFNNYMEYTNDSCYNLFTNDQKAIAMAAIHGPLAKLVQSNACVPLGINELSSNTNINIYPNPSTGNFTVRILGVYEQAYIADVYNMLGEKVYSSTEAHNTITLNLNNCSNGVYLLRLSDEHSSIVKKLVIDR